MKEQKTIDLILAEERTLLAAERTFSAWIRTALAAMAGGLAIMRFIVFKTDLHRIIAHGIGETLIVWGCVLIILSSIDYTRAHKNLSAAKNYKSSPLGSLVVIVPLLVISILLIWVTLP